ncbi:adenine-specific methyltransferase EcoRI family protein [Moraxella sp. 7664LN]|uniref:adenine-specific methyltransferase EcoRI family protein n=1 Tax=Moraxella sp. 7664LN TaxID=3093635 RepID=UPI002B416A99|nr:adenine-specific methyltransferase EcoRI family protein [Moraxella sp. 7664LN]
MSKYISPAFLEAKTGVKQDPTPKRATPSKTTQSKPTKAKKATATDSGNSTLHKAKKAKNDEFYTCLADIENELRHYKAHFKDKIVYCNCDDPYESNFLQYFLLNFRRLGLKKLISTGYATSPIAGTQLSLFDDDFKAHKIEITSVDGLKMHDGKFDNLTEWLKERTTPLKGNTAKDGTVYLGGDFRSKECIKLLCEADIVVTNPPFSLFREYIAQLVAYNKKFLVIGNINAITYKEIFPLIKNNELWIGYNCTRHFCKPDGTLFETARTYWYTNLDIAKRHEKFILHKKYNPNDYPKYDNYNAIEVSQAVNIPMDYDGAMGVPITFLDKYNPEQFELIGQMVTTKIDEYNFGYPYLDRKKIYARILIKQKGAN